MFISHLGLQSQEACGANPLIGPIANTYCRGEALLEEAGFISGDRSTNLEYGNQGL